MSGKLNPLSELSGGSKAVIRRISGGRALGSRLAVLGFTVGAHLEVQRNPGFGPVIVLIRDSRIALGRGEARKIIVERLK